MLTSTPAGVSVSTAGERVSTGSVSSVSSGPDVHSGLSTDQSLEEALYEASGIADERNVSEKISELKTEDSNSSVLLLLNSAIEALDCETVNCVNEAISTDDKPMVGENVPVVDNPENVSIKEDVNSEELDVNRAKNVKFVWLGSSQRDKEVDSSNC